MNETYYTNTKALIAFASKLTAGLPKLQEVSVAFRLRFYKNSNDINAFFTQLLLKVNLITHLSLSLFEYIFNSKTISCITSLLCSHKLRNLQSLTLYFDFCKSLSNSVLIKIAESICQNLQNLLRFELYLYPPTSAGIKPLLNSIKALLDIEGITDRGLVDFGRILSKGNLSLEDMNIRINNGLQVSDKGVRKFCDKIAMFKELKAIVVEFG